MREDIEKAYHRVKPYIYRTPLVKAHTLSHAVGANVYYKLENIQITGAFKVRGAFNKMLSLSEEEKQKGVVAASSGNFGAAVSYASKTLDIKAKLFVPNTTPSSKLDTIRLFGGELECVGDDYGETERHAREYAKAHQLPYLSPYNDYQVVCGQGTIGVELSQQLDAMDEVYVAVGGGGLISGIGAYLKSINKNIRMVGCLPEASPVMYDCVKAGKIVDCEVQPTLSDGTAGNHDPDSITLEYCQRYVDDYFLLSEADIAKAIQTTLAQEHMLVEGAAAVPIAAVVNNADKIQGKTIVVIICGANISIETLKTVIC